MAKTIYVYNKDTGQISYTVENAKAENLRILQNRGVSFFIDSVNHNIVGTYVMKDENTETPIGIEKIKEMNFVLMTKNEIIADGIDMSIIAPLMNGTTVNIPREDFSFVSDSENNAVELTADGYSLDSTQNIIDVQLSKYGYKNKSFKVFITPDVS